MATKKLRKRTRQFAGAALTLGTSTALVSQLGRTGGPAVQNVTAPVLTGLGTAGRFLGIGATAAFGSIALESARDLQRRNRRFRF